MTSWIKIDAPGVMGQNTTVVYIEESQDGTRLETDISPCVRGVEFNAKVGEPNTAKLDCIKVHGTSTAELTEIVVKEHKRRRRWFRTILRDVTTLGQRYRVYS